jgi:capsular exopolysaccharide synthesis family protein
MEQVKSLSNMERKDELEKMKVKLQNAKVLEDMLRERYNVQLQAAERSGDKTLELEFTRAELSLKEKVFEMIAERSMALNTELRAPGRVSLLHRAEPPSDPLQRLPFRELALVGLMSFCLPFGLAIMWEHWVRRISDVSQLAPLVDMAVLGEIAHLPKSQPGQGLFHSGRQMKLFEESINSLRVGLVLPEYMQGLRVIAVSSAVHSEGKSSISSQLAVSIARATGEPILIIDGDMRSPDIHRIFSLSNEPGLTKVLDKLCTINDAIITDWSEYLHVLPAGKLHRSPYNLLGRSAFKDLISELKTKYRYIIVDTPPILSASEALVLAKAADGVLLCTRRNYSRERQVRLAHQRLVAAGANPLGAVFNAVPTSRYAYTYGDYDYTTTAD